MCRVVLNVLPVIMSWMRKLHQRYCMLLNGRSMFFKMEQNISGHNIKSQLLDFNQLSVDYFGIIEAPCERLAL